MIVSANFVTNHRNPAQESTTAFGDYHFLLSIGVKNEDWGVIILDKIPIKTTLPEQ